MASRGQFITFEGGEGCGKSTQVKLLSQALSERGIEHIITREPGGTPLAERVRPLLVENQVSGVRSQESEENKEGGQQADPAMSLRSGSPCENQEIFTGQLKEDWSPLAETLLFLAARVQHVQQRIEPALAAGKWVICDRFTDSTLVYQGVGKGLGVEYLQHLQQHVLPDFAPDKTILLDIAPEVGLKRAASRADNETRFEQLDLSFHQKLRNGFLQLAKQPRFTVIDASQTIEDIHNQVVKAIL